MICNTSSRILLLSNRTDVFYFCRSSLEGLFTVELLSLKNQRIDAIERQPYFSTERLMIDSSFFFTRDDTVRFFSGISGIDVRTVFLCPHDTKGEIIDLLRMFKASLIHIPCEKEFFRGGLTRKFSIAGNQEHFIQYNGCGKLEKFIGKSESVQKVRQKVAEVAVTDCSVLFTGETGTGKSFLAKILHEMSDRSSKHFVRVNSADLKESVAVSNLYGTINGAFTGAVSKPGHFSVANGGVIFFDEIGTMHISVQESLLTVLDTGSFYKVGSVVEQKVDVRFLSATNADLRELLYSGAFRKDLYNRISDCVIRIPALRERPDDIPEVMEYFLRMKNCCDIVFSTDAIDFMLNFYWPGNMRDILHCAEFLRRCYSGKLVRADDIAEWAQTHCII